MQSTVQSESDSAENKIEPPILDCFTYVHVCHNHYFQQFHGTYLLSLYFFPDYELLMKDSVMWSFLKKKKEDT
jgi:hypothetical protein